MLLLPETGVSWYEKSCRDSSHVFMTFVTISKINWSNNFAYHDACGRILACLFIIGHLDTFVNESCFRSIYLISCNLHEKYLLLRTGVCVAITNGVLEWCCAKEKVKMETTKCQTKNNVPKKFNGTSMGESPFVNMLLSWKRQRQQRLGTFLKLRIY